MADKLWFILPELWLFVGAVIAAVMGLSRTRVLRDVVPYLVSFFLIAALVAIPFVYADDAKLARAGLLMPAIGPYVKMVVCSIGVVLAMLSVGLIDRDLEDAFRSGRSRFDPIRVSRGDLEKDSDPES